MRDTSHWTPRYIVNRVRSHFYQRQNVDKPWLTPRSIQLLSTLLLPSDVGVEWGSGRSTIWLARHLKHLTSVEHDEGWYARVKQQLIKEDVANVAYHHAPEQPVGDEARWNEYVAAGSSFPDASLGFALVDGEARDYCAEAIMPKLAPGGLLVIDNANLYIDYPTRSPYSRSGRGASTDSWARISEDLVTWRMIWTSCGVWDTAIYIKSGAPESTRR